MVVSDPAVGPHPAPYESAVPVVDEFYNVAGKAPHLNVIMPKRESGWWINREMQKKRKAEERANAMLELQQAVDEATRLA